MIVRRNSISAAGHHCHEHRSLRSWSSHEELRQLPTDSDSIDALILSTFINKITDPIPGVIPNTVASVPIPGGRSFMDLPEDIRNQIYRIVLKAEWVLKPIPPGTRNRLLPERRATAQCEAYHASLMCVPGYMKDRLSIALCDVIASWSDDVWERYYHSPPFAISAWMAPDLVDTDLFRVSKTIRCESLAIFWLHNTFRLEPVPQTMAVQHQKWQASSLLAPRAEYGSRANTRRALHYLYLDDDDDDDIDIEDAVDAHNARLEGKTYQTSIVFSAETRTLLEQARHMAIVAPWILQPSLVQILKRRADLLSVSFHPYGNMSPSRWPWSHEIQQRKQVAHANIARSITEPLRLGSVVSLDLTGCEYAFESAEEHERDMLAMAVQKLAGDYCRRAESVWDRARPERLVPLRNRMLGSGNCRDTVIT